MRNVIKINQLIKPFDKVLQIEGDKSLSIRWALMASQSNSKSIAYNLLKSEDVLNTLFCLRKLGVKIKIFNNRCEINGVGLNGFTYRKNLVLDCGNSGTLSRLILGLLIHSKSKIKIIGDKSLSRRDFKRIIDPLKKFGANFQTKSNNLPIIIQGTENPVPIKYYEKKGSAQCKSSVMLAALNTKGKTIIKAKKSRDHSELLFKYLKLPIKVIKKNNYDIIEVYGLKKIKQLNYNIPSDVSSSSFFIVLTILSKKSKLVIKGVNLNPSRLGILKILKLMGINVIIKNIIKYKGETVGDLYIKNEKNIMPIKCPPKLNSSAIDEFLLIFLVAAKAKGVSYFKNLSELNEKESPRLKWGAKILSKIGIKNILTENGITIYGNPNLKISKKIIIKNFLKDHRVFMTSVIAAISFGGEWEIHDKDAIKSSFPTFFKKLRQLGLRL